MTGPYNENSDPNLTQDKDHARRSTFTRQGPLKHYEVPSLSSMLYEYTNKEKDIVERAFRGGNYQSLRSLPDDIRPYNVGQALKQKI